MALTRKDYDKEAKKNPPKKVDPKTGETFRQKWEDKYYKNGNFLDPNRKPDGPRASKKFNKSQYD